MTGVSRLLLLFAMISDQPDLQALRDHYRAVLLFAHDGAQPEIAAQRASLDAHASEVKDRDLKIFELTGSSDSARMLRHQFGVKPDEAFAVVLIGKDGTRKLHKSRPVDPAEIFRLIDSMPMRKAEMREDR